MSKWGVGTRFIYLPTKERCTVVRREAHFPSQEYDDTEYTLVQFDGQDEHLIVCLSDVIREPVEEPSR